MTVQNLIKHGTARARFEADKLQRSLKTQGELNALRSSIQKALMDLAKTTFALYQQGKLQEPELVDIAQDIVSLNAQAAEKETQLNCIKAETFAEPERLQTAAVTDKQKCPRCKRDLPAELRFCIHCGQALGDR